MENFAETPQVKQNITCGCDLCYNNKVFSDPVYLPSKYLLIIKLFSEEKGEMSWHWNST